MKNIKMSELFSLPMSAHDNDGEMSLADKEYYLASFEDTMTYEDGHGLARAEYAAIAINAYDTNQARIAELEGVLREITKEENIREIKDWVTCGMTNSVSASSDTGLIANKYNNFFDLISRATTLVSHRDIIKAAEGL